MIKPTVGRVVLYTPSSADNTIAKLDNQPLAAIVACVWSDTCVNLAVFDSNGVATNRTSVLLIQDDAPKPSGGNYAEWMPYQIGQAKKAAE